MKILNYLFRPYFVIRQLQKENKDLKASVIALKEEIKQADEQGTNYQALLNTKAIGEA